MVNDNQVTDILKTLDTETGARL